MSKLILIRHGESVWNLKNVFTGWVDVPLSKKGINEAIDAGKTMENILFDVVFTSVQVRAIETAMIILAQNNSDKTPVILHEEKHLQAWTHIYSKEMAANTLPIYTDWHLNERYYGELQGLNKQKTALKYGNEKVQEWRRSYDVQPPHGESLKDTAERTIPFFKEKIIPQLAADKTVLIAAHGNSLRSIIMYIENSSPEQLLQLELPTGIPLFYDYDNETITRSQTQGF